MKKNVCLFFMHLVPIRASEAKLCMVYPYVRGRLQEIMEYGSMLKLDWSTIWPIGFYRTFMVSNVLSVKFSGKMFQNDDNILQRGFFNSKLM
jgi:hypothetical protein